MEWLMFLQETNGEEIDLDGSLESTAFLGKAILAA